MNVAMPEVWLRGPVAGVPPELMPVVHSLLQVREELEAVVAPLSQDQVWARPGGAGSIGFHLKHLAGSLDRLLTYASGDALSRAQLAFLDGEGRSGSESPADLLRIATAGIDAAMERVRAVPASTLGESRRVGRAGLPSTVLGLLFHAAEHAQRHAGQIVTTAKVLTNTST
jgi:hypothetical protein